MNEALKKAGKKSKAATAQAPKAGARRAVAKRKARSLFQPASRVFGTNDSGKVRLFRQAGGILAIAIVAMLCRPSMAQTAAEPTNAAPVVSTNAPVAAKPDIAAATPAVASSTNSAPETPAPVKTDLASFRVISDHNIFNPTRSGRSNYRPPTVSRRNSRVDSFSLVGVLGYEKGEFAFFDGTSSQYRKTLSPGDSIAGYKVEAIGTNEVRMSAGGKSFALALGSQMRREDSGNWSISNRGGSPDYAPAPSTSSSPSGGASTSASGPSSGGSSGGADDVLARMMRNREQQLNK